MSDPRFRTALDAVLLGERLPVMHHQPIVDLRRGAVVGYEALARFPGQPQLPPDEWFRSAGTRGKRHQLERMVARLAIESRDLLPQDTFLTVNVSPLFLMSDDCNRLFAEIGDLSRIVLEVTEGDRVDDYTLLRKRLDCVRKRGGNIAVDDTGSGYASLKHVMELRPQFVKLDRFFISGCQSEPAKAAMIHMLGEAADRMDAWLVAEGIEEEPELFELMRQGVPLGQGYLLGRPAPEMQPLAGSLAASIRKRSSAAPANNSLVHHLESALLFDSLLDAQETLRRSPQASCAVVVDEHTRPLHLVEYHPLMGVRTVPAPMRVQVESSLVEVLRRAMSRTVSQRFDPVVTINGRGTYQGVLRIDRLTQAMLSVN
jgi:EAL domain-containing protein (putative c-di-GMP-specific phosphodiesterase class I)